jgi:diaminohydroxyphosphoribosylaminopyrimidine deaminase/5-amino-6-(5-phosphoribosylamino)uracil reductase
VVWAVADPNPVNRGRAARRLRAAGIETACWEKDRAHCAVVSRAQTLIAPFAKRIATGRPYVTVKLAMSLDGRICDVSGRSKWMSSPHARRVTGDYRARVDVVLVGAETVRKDDPSLLCHTRENPDLWRAVISRSGKLPRGARIFTDAAASRTLVYRDVASAIEDLGRRGFLHVFCEGGLVLARALADAGLVDQWIHVQCPFVLGESPLGRAWRFTAFSPSGHTPQGETIARFSAPRRG